MKPEETC